MVSQLPRATPTGGRRVDPPHLARVTAIIGGLIAATLWAAATLASSRSSRMLGSRVVLAWVMVIGCLVGIPLAAIDAPVERLEPSTIGLLAIAGICYVAGLGLTYAALQIGKVSIVAPIVATEGAVAAVIAVSLGDTIGLAAGVILAVIAIGVVLSSIDRSGTDVPAGDTDLVADALDGPPPPPSALSDTPPLAPGDARRSAAAGHRGGARSSGWVCSRAARPPRSSRSRGSPSARDSSASRSSPRPSR